jgi:DNA-binding CsgD family transcriptional regulator
MSRALDEIHQRYFELIRNYPLNRQSLDYSRLEAHRPFLDALDRVGHSVVSVFDMATLSHPYKSDKYMDRLGAQIPTGHRVEDGLDSLIHPDDRLQSAYAGYHYMSQLLNGSLGTSRVMKMVNEYRIRRSEPGWIRVSESHQVLEHDSDGHAWLVLSVIEIAANQDESLGFESRLINSESGDVISYSVSVNPLSERESEALKLIANGHSSKQIADLLFVSPHTVNTHRQNILKKMKVANTAEAISIARMKRWI